MFELSNVRRWIADGTATRIRVAASLTQGELAAACGVTPSSVSNWEGGRRTPRRLEGLIYAQMLMALAEKTGAAQFDAPVRCAREGCTRWAASGTTACWVHGLGT